MATANDTTKFLQLKLPNPKIADTGQVRLGDAAVTGRFPRLSLPNRKIVDRGIVRLGDAAVTGRFPICE